MNPEKEHELAHILLVELLAYQFAWPVRWIETQDVILNELKAERIIEIGPQPILKNMANRTLANNSDIECSNAMPTRFVKCTATDLHEIYYDTPSEKTDATNTTTATTNKKTVSVDTDLLKTFNMHPDFSSEIDTTPFDQYSSYSRCVNDEVLARDGKHHPDEGMAANTNASKTHPFLKPSTDVASMGLFSHIQTLNKEIQDLKENNLKVENEFGKGNVESCVVEMFKPTRIRTFDSYWNWNKFEIFKFCTSIDTTNKYDMEKLELLVGNTNSHHQENHNLQKIMKYFNKSLTIDETDKFQRIIKKFKYVQDLMITPVIGTDNVLETANFSNKLQNDMTSYYKIESYLFEVYSKIMTYAASSTGKSIDVKSEEITNGFQNIYEQLLVFLRNSNEVNPFFRNIVGQAMFSLNKAHVNDPILDDVSGDESAFELNDDSAFSSRCSSLLTDTEDDVMEDEPRQQSRRPSTMEKVSYELPQLKGVVPPINIKAWTKETLSWNYDKALTHQYLSSLITPNYSFLESKNILLSISKITQFSLLVVKSLLKAGSHVYILQSCTELSEISKFSKQLEPLYKDHAVETSRMTIIPLNLHSKVDCVKFIEYYYNQKATEFDMFVPLVTFVEEKSTAYDNTKFLINTIVTTKQHLVTDTAQMHVLLPTINPQYLSHLNEFEIANENKNFVTYMGYNLDLPQDESNSAGIENAAQNFMGLLSYSLVSKCYETTLTAELNESPSASLKEVAIDDAEINNTIDTTQYVQPKVCTNLIKPNLETFQNLQNEFNGEILQGLVDLDSTVVITGFGEIGPYGHAQTRWEIEATGELSIEGCLEMAWLMGYITFDNSKNTWIDSKSKEPVQEIDVKAVYESQILENSGIRMVDPSLFGGYTPNKKTLLQEVVLTHDLQPIEMSKEMADQYVLEHDDQVEVQELESGQCLVTFLKGCCLMVPKALHFDRFVAGQVPSGWDPKSYGLSQDVIDQVDRITLFALIATAEALITSGIIDPFELYQYIHVSEVGNCSGSGIGGLQAQAKVQKGRMLDQDVQNDILQETFLNVMPAWVNMLLLSSSGPIKTPVGACATAIESLEVGTETILSGKAQFVLVGGQDDYGEELAYEFASMGATSNSQTEIENGRIAKEMCRPMTSTRDGFMESQGSGIQVLTTASLAVKMGLPIFGVVGSVSLASDKIGKSLPAPGQGVLTAARQIPSRFKPKKLDISYRKLQVENSLQNLFYDQPITEESIQTFKESKKYWGNTYFKNDPKISPIIGSLSMFGLSIDDISVSSCHGTSTKANDKNESSILNTIMNHLGRSSGNPLPIICQKGITGHPKAAAGAWMINGALQMFHDSVIPGGVNYDNIDVKLKEFEHLVYPPSSVKVSKVKAITLTSFGFGQKGALAVLINPNYLLASLNQIDYESYCKRSTERYYKAQKFRQNGILTNKLIQEKNDAPYTDEMKVYLNPLARANEDFFIDGDDDCGNDDFNPSLKQHKIQEWSSDAQVTCHSFASECAQKYFSSYNVSVIPASDGLFRMVVNGHFVQNMIVYCAQYGRKSVCTLYSL